MQDGWMLDALAVEVPFGGSAYSYIRAIYTRAAVDEHKDQGAYTQRVRIRER